MCAKCVLMLVCSDEHRLMKLSRLRQEDHAENTIALSLKSLYIKGEGCNSIHIYSV